MEKETHNLGKYIKMFFNLALLNLGLLIALYKDFTLVTIILSLLLCILTILTVNSKFRNSVDEPSPWFDYNLVSNTISGQFKTVLGTVSSHLRKRDEI